MSVTKVTATAAILPHERKHGQNLGKTRAFSGPVTVINLMASWCYCHYNLQFSKLYKTQNTYVFQALIWSAHSLFGLSTAMAASADVYLVLGGDVFTGRHVVEQLKARGDTVFVFDSTQRHDDVECVPGDICVLEQISNAIQKVLI